MRRVFALSVLCERSSCQYCYRHLSHSCVFITLEIAVSPLLEVCELLKVECSEGPIDVRCEGGDVVRMEK